MCTGNWNKQISGTNIPREAEGLDWVNWQLTNSLKFNHRQKFRIDMRKCPSSIYIKLNEYVPCKFYPFRF